MSVDGQFESDLSQTQNEDEENSCGMKNRFNFLIYYNLFDSGAAKENESQNKKLRKCYAGQKYTDEFSNESHDSRLQLPLTCK